MKDNSNKQSLEIIKAIIEELNIYHGDRKHDFKHNVRELQDIIYNIEVLTKNYRCQCGKLIDSDDIGNYECGYCGIRLPSKLEESIKQLEVFTHE